MHIFNTLILYTTDGSFNDNLFLLVPTLRTRSGSGTSLGSGKSDDEDSANKEQIVQA
jgi:hypothetical protein